MLPLSLLRTAQNHPMLVELKNGETYNGHLVSCDNWMNINLREVICTSRDGDKFWRMPECYIRGSTIKYLRIPDEVIDMVKEEMLVKGRGRGDMNKRGGMGPRGGRGGRGAEAGEVPAAGEAAAVDKGEGEEEDAPAWDRLASGQWFPFSTSPVLQCAKKIASSGSPRSGADIGMRKDPTEQFGSRQYGVLWVMFTRSCVLNAKEDIVKIEALLPSAAQMTRVGNAVAIDTRTWAT
ncbi:hypothetical protein HPB47_025557 [Ixodes persulcatus]|uniref:Uncharacterized protein n=1 Tax=Ixodes persulcatus TaxID=34615 RepID=A0AC60Q1R8_IXOPE|nr:hypothetical protein HPB47_025557 [Ixodes persulcatus]